MAKAQFGVSWPFCSASGNSQSFALMILPCYFFVMPPRFDLLVSYLNFEGRNLLGAVGTARANQNKAKIVKIAVPVLAMLLLLTAAVVSTTPDDRASLLAFFHRDKFLTFCVLLSTTIGCSLAWMAVTATTEASRRSYAWATVRCFALLAINLYLALSNLPDVDDAA